jgi:hypothetical protein
MDIEKGRCRSKLLSEWFPPTHPVHNLPIAERIYPEILSQGIPPTQPLEMTASLLSQHGEQGFERGASNPKIANSMSVMVWYVLGQEGNELQERITSFPGIAIFNYATLADFSVSIY